MKVVYIAGPFRAANAWLVEQNIRRAEELALEVWRMGAACICPHANTRFFDGACPDETFLLGDMEILKRCDAILLVTGWHRSEGATIEMDYALRNNIPVFESECDLRVWLKASETPNSL